MCEYSANVLNDTVILPPLHAPTAVAQFCDVPLLWRPGMVSDREIPGDVRPLHAQAVSAQTRNVHASPLYVKRSRGNPLAYSRLLRAPRAIARSRDIPDTRPISTRPDPYTPSHAHWHCTAGGGPQIPLFRAMMQKPIESQDPPSRADHPHRHHALEAVA